MIRRNVDELINEMNENDGKLTDDIGNNIKVEYKKRRDNYVTIRMTYKNETIYIDGIDTNSDTNISRHLTFIYDTIDSAFYKIKNYSDVLYEMSVAEKIFIAWVTKVNEDNHTCVSSTTLTIYE